MTLPVLSETFRDFQLLKLKYDALLSNFAFNFHLRHYTKVKSMKSMFLEAMVGRVRFNPGFRS